MAGLDLSALVPVIEDLILQDTIRFTTPGGPPVFNSDTGQYEQTPGTVFYEGPGSVQVAGTVGGVTSLPAPNQPWVDETRSKYKAFTPLSAPIAERATIVSVVAVHANGDPSLIGRRWRAQDPSIGGTLGVVRQTTLDQIEQTREA